MSPEATTAATIAATIAATLREVAPQVLAAVIRRYRDFAASEDAVQEAMIAAAAQWPVSGMPDNPRGWLIRVAAWKMTDAQRSDGARRRRENEVVSLVPQAMVIDETSARIPSTSAAVAIPLPPAFAG